MNYKVSVTAKRGKICIIKVIRAITHWGLKDSKDFVEREFMFDAWMTDWATFDVVLSPEQFARLAHHVAMRRSMGVNYNDCDILNSEEISPVVGDPFDFTKGESS